MLKIKKFSKPFNNNKSVFSQYRRSIKNTMHEKGLKFAPVVQLAKLNLTYITVVK